MEQKENLARVLKIKHKLGRLQGNGRLCLAWLCPSPHPPAGACPTLLL